MGKINLQMYSFMDGTMNDSKENFRAASEMGYDGVEMFGPNFEIPPEELIPLLNELNLEAVSLHAPASDMAVSYTHLDVYKRQGLYTGTSEGIGLYCNQDAGILL